MGTKIGAGMADGWVEAERPADHRKYGRKGYANDVEEFVASGKACVSKDFGEMARNAYMSLYQAAKRNGHPVGVMRRGTTVFLVRTDVDDES